MPAAPSSPIPAGLGQLAGSEPARPDELPNLLDRLRRLPDPRRPRGRRHPLSYVLALAACSVLAGAKSLTAIAEWAADAPDQLLLRCGATLRDPDRPYRAPSEATVRRVLQRIDGDALDAAIGGWLTVHANAARAANEDTHPPSRPVRAAIAVDGKSVRGVMHADGRCVHLLSALPILALARTGADRRRIGQGLLQVPHLVRGRRPEARTSPPPWIAGGTRSPRSSTPVGVHVNVVLARFP